MSFKDWTTREIVVGAVLGVAVGVIFWAWGLLWSSVFQVVPFPAQYVLVGLWMMGGLLVPYVVVGRAPPCLGELVAAFVSMAWGTSGASSPWPAVSCRAPGPSWCSRPAAGGASRRVLYGAGALAGVLSILLDSFVYSY